jgi:hypothetical protein
VQCDGYAAYKTIADAACDEAVTLAFCWAHLRRRFYDIAEGGPAPIASEALARIAALYAIEKTIRGRSAAGRQSAPEASLGFAAITGTPRIENGGTFAVDFADGRRNRHNFYVRPDAPQQLAYTASHTAPLNRSATTGGPHPSPRRRASTSRAERYGWPTILGRGWLRIEA